MEPSEDQRREPKRRGTEPPNAERPVTEAGEATRDDGYAAAHELAATGRYREARECLAALLQRDPADVEALVLLGKVEFYLRHAASSRRCFETALAYEPGNMAAFFGLEYFRQRSRWLLAAASMLLLCIAVAGAGALLAWRLEAAMRQLGSSVDATVTERVEAGSAALSASLEGIASDVKQLRAASESDRAATGKSLSDLAAELQKLRRGNASLHAEIERLRNGAAAASPGP